MPAWFSTIFMDPVLFFLAVILYFWNLLRSPGKRTVSADGTTALPRPARQRARVPEGSTAEKRISFLKRLWQQLGQKKVKIGDLSLFSRQLAVLVDAGVPLTRSLYTLAGQTVNKELARVVGETARHVEGGMSLTDAISRSPHVFSSLYVGMVSAGETGGTLQASLMRLSEQLQKDKFLRDTIRSATIYPLMIAIFSALLLLGMLIFLVPVFTNLFPPGIELPLPTIIVIAISDSLRNYWLLWLFIAVSMVVGTSLFLRSSTGKRLWDELKFRLPIFGPLLHRAVIARFSRTLSTLFSGGIPVVRALESAGAATGNTLVERAVQKVANRVQEGESIAVPLEESPVFPPMMTQMVAVGEESGALPELLNRIAEYFEEEVATMTKTLTSLIEPVMLVVVGLVVGAMILSLYMPIFIAITQVA